MKKKKTADPPHRALLADALVSCGPIQSGVLAPFCFDHFCFSRVLVRHLRAWVAIAQCKMRLSTVHSRNSLCETNDTRSWRAGWFLFELPGCVHVRVRCYRSQSTVAERFSSGFVVSSNDQMMMDDG